ncbi:alpha/beta hydrolase [Rhodococcus erythropolis]|uniref:Alpha/beta hydrolase family protein n=1 Tax=Rhodococcus erythropolis TaxID=1833 RepID=A0AAX3V5X8_RHOER|nr:alpha/beta hydrolase family protein [Rhodococcus erythropolis]WGV49046.2 alpha/beta hydrolase family protein [Rhodococcus erythropolis]
MQRIRFRLPERNTRRARVLVAAALSVFLLGGMFGPTAASATPAHTAPWGGYDELWVPSSMGNVKVQVQWAARGGNAALYLLDGLRAQNDRNAWSFETNALDQYRNDNITLVMPVGGESSFYTDWYAPSNFNAQPITYRWETFLTRELPDFLAGYGVSPTNNAIIGLSMGGSAALNLAGHHRDQFKFAGSLSGYINISGPGMREAIRVAMFDAGRYNVDSMWGPPWSSGWLRNDPFVNAESLRGLSMYISSSNGIPGPYDHPSAPIDYFHTATGMGLEALSWVHARAFEIRLKSMGIPATYSFPPAGIHSWPYWSAELWMARGQILDAMNAW